MNSETKKPGKDVTGDELTELIIGAAIRVHTESGPGFLESVYEEALAVELRLSGLQFERQKPVPIFYRARPVGEHRVDLFVENSIVVELKATTAFEKIHFAVPTFLPESSGRHERAAPEFRRNPINNQESRARVSFASRQRRGNFILNPGFLVSEFNYA
jgi:GxxExxY protein